jgi:hypothetical protein
MTVCQRCSELLRPQDKFCGNCGLLVPGTPAPAPFSGSPLHGTNDGLFLRTANTGTQWLIGCLAAIVVLAVALMVIGALGTLFGVKW